MTALCFSSASFGFGYDFLLGVRSQQGSETYYEVEYSDGSKQEFIAGNGLVFYGGVLLQPLVVVDWLEVKATLGYQSVRDRASNAEARFLSYPSELGVRLNHDRWYLGAGMLNSFRTSFQVDDQYTDIDVPPGSYFELGYSIVNIGITQLTYEVEGTQWDASARYISLELAF